MDCSSLFPTFRKFYSRISIPFWETCAFVLLELLIALLLIAQFTILHWKLKCYEFLFFAVGVLLVLFAILYTGFVYIYATSKWRASPLLVTDISFVFFLIWGGISTLFSESPLHSFVGSSYRKEGFATYLIYAAALITARAVQSSRYQRILLWTLGCVGALLSVFTLLESEPTLRWLLSNDNIFPGSKLLGEYHSVFYNLNHFAYFLTMTLLALAGIFVFGKRNTQTAVSLPVFFFTAAVLIRNNTLGCILAVALGLIFLCGITLSYDRKFFQRSLFVLAAYLLVMLFVPRVNATFSGDFEEIYEALNGTADDTANNAFERLHMWRQSMAQIAQTPLFGVGLDGGNGITFIAGIDRPHNEYIQYALFTGIPGGIAYLMGLISLFVCCIRRLKKLPIETLILGTMVFGYAVSAFVGNSMYYTTVYFAVILGLIMAAVKSFDLSATD